MKKIMTVLVLLFALTACTESASETSTTASESTPRSSGESLSDLASVFGMSGDFKCTYRVDDIEQVSQIKNGKMRSDTTVDGKQMHTIMNGDKMWMWSSEGCFYMDLNDIKEMAKSLPDAVPQTAQTREDIAASAVDVDCERATVSDSVFTPPSPCQDMGAMLKQLQSYQ